jgi:phosphoribosylamine--glycine ligase
VGVLEVVRVLVVGSGAREHALVRALLSDPDVAEVVAAPGNAGIAAEVATRPLAVSDPAAVAALAVELSVDLVVVGPEVPLVAGAADAVRAAGIACFGPSAAAARLEGSKAFAKEVMTAAEVPTARALVCATGSEAAAALDELGAPYVVKDDGLAAGKGVVVTDDREAALAHAASCERVVVEEYLDGPEVSLFAVTDGATVLPLVPAQDFKRVGDGDTGPNTGGMGAYSPLPWAPPGLVDEVHATVLQPTVDEMARRGTPFAGLLYAGLALTSRGVRVIEFNARFGDPETQVVLARLRSPLGSLLRAAADGSLASLGPLEWSPDAAVTVVVAAKGYPESPRTGDPVDGLSLDPYRSTSVRPDDGRTGSGSYVLHAGTRRDEDGRVVSAGGRVLSVVGTGHDVRTARDRAYAAVARISLDGAHWRRDIAEGV